MIKTIKTKQFRIIAALLAVVLTVSCVMWNTTEVHAQEINIGNANVQGYSLLGSTRAIADGKLVGTSDAYATMGVFITGGSATKYNVTNMKWQHNGTGWTSEETVLFEGANSQQQIYACSPYAWGDADDGKVTVAATDQTDWLVATSKPLTSGDINLTMTHALTKLVLNPTFGSEVINKTIANVEIGGMYASGDLNIKDNTWSNLSEANATLTMWDNEALVIPMDCESFTVTITIADGRVFTTTVTCPDGGLAADTQYNINLQVGQDTVTLGDIKAESWGIPVDGGKLETE